METSESYAVLFAESEHLGGRRSMDVRVGGVGIFRSFLSTSLYIKYQNLNILAKAADSCRCLVHSVVSSLQPYHIKYRTNPNISVIHNRWMHAHDGVDAFRESVESGRKKRSIHYLEIPVFLARLAMSLSTRDRCAELWLSLQRSTTGICIGLALARTGIGEGMLCGSALKVATSATASASEHCYLLLSTAIFYRRVQYMRLMDNAQMGCGIFIGFVSRSQEPLYLPNKPFSCVLFLV
uniref:Uncharacterized protein n=1 Tax=Ananas comosus var. bracteatus TaxID=296719 RepID=A0A6V7NPW3_ANACO|nr:unnamed protein product [Ananas comosus var. bracteatus]